jgi:ATP-dependent Clp protease adaptor protein ClpS
MEERKTVSKESVRIREDLREPKMYVVYVLNDDMTTFEFVVYLMMSVFRKTEEDAWGIAERTHREGKAAVGRYTLDMAHTKVNKAVALSRENNFPLNFKIVPEDQHEK